MHALCPKPGYRPLTQTLFVASGCGRPERVFMFANSWGHAGRIALAAIFVLPSAHAQSEFQSNRFDLLAALDPVVVTASKIEEPRGQATVLIDVIQRDEIEASGVISITELLDRLPGINIIRQYGRLGIDASIDIGYLGGSAHHRTLIMVDGVRVNDVDDGTVSLSAIPLSAIERIEIRRAGGGVLFGDRALGGVINIITKPEKKDRTVVTGSAGSFGLRTIGTSISRIADKNSFHLDAQHAKLDGYRRNSQQEQTSLLSRILIPTKIGELGFVFRASDENLTLPYAISLDTFKADPKTGIWPTDSRRENRSGTVTLDTQFSPNFKTSIKLNTEDLKRLSYTNYTTKRNSFIFDSTKNYGLTTLLFGAEAFYADSLSNRDSRSRVVQSSNALYFSLEKNLETAKIMLGARSQAMKNEFFTTAESAAQTSSDRLTSWSLAARKPFFGGILRGGLQSSFAFPNTDQLFTFKSAFPYTPKSIYPDISPMKSKEVQLGWFHQFDQDTLDFSLRRILIQDEIGIKSDCIEIGFDCNDNVYDTKRTVFSTRYTRPISTNTKFDIAFDFISAQIESGQNQGKQIPLTPTRSVKANLVHAMYGGYGMLLVNHRSAMFAQNDDPNSQAKIPPRTLIDLGWRRAFNSNFDIQMWVRNLMNKQYYDFAAYEIFDSSYGVAPGDGRSIDFSLRYKF
jgi:iron complex outermembrane receptor protein